MKFSQLLKSYRINGSQLLVELFGTLLTEGAQYNQTVTLVYGATVNLDASAGNNFYLAVTDGNAFAFAAPTDPPPAGFSETINITIANTSGGALGTGTWNAIYKTDGNVPAIADGFNRTFTFQWNGTNWVETSQSAADVPN